MLSRATKRLRPVVAYAATGEGLASVEIVLVALLYVGAIFFVLVI